MKRPRWKAFPIDCANFLPKEGQPRDFWTYEGSLTTPPLLESVIWVVFQQPIKICAGQMEAMRSLNFTNEESDEGKMVDNYRPPCDLYARVVRKM